MADNPYYVPPVNIGNALQQLMSGYDFAQKNQQAQALREAGQLYASGDVAGAQAAAARGGSLQTLMGLTQLSQSDRDFGFKQTEAERNQGNTVFSQGLQRDQFTESSRHNRATEAQAAEGLNKPIVVPFGSGLANRKGEMIKEPGLGETGAFDDATLTQLAQQAIAGDTSVFTNLGRGNQGAANVIALRKKIAELNANAGEDGASQANRNAEFFGAKAGQRALGNKQANIELAATEFKQVLPVVMAASDAVDRTNYPLLNKIIQAGQENIGDPNIVKLGSGINTLVNLYSRAISPNGVPTVNDKNHAYDILQKAWSSGQFNAAVGMMQQEIDAALTSPEKVRQQMRDRFKSGQPGGAPPQTQQPQNTQPESQQPSSGGVRWRVIQ